MMSTTTANELNNHNNCRKQQQASHLQFTTYLLLLLQLTLFTGWLLMDVVVVASAEVPAELMLEGVSLLKSMEYAQQQQANQQHNLLQQQQQQQHALQQHQQHKQQQAPTQQLHGQTKRFAAFSTTNSDGSDIDVDLAGMQPPALSSGDISRFERELFLASAIEDDDDTLTDNIEQPLEPEGMEGGADLMEHAIDYKQHPALWLQQHNNNNNGGHGAAGDGKMSSNTFLKLHHHPIQQQQQEQQQQQQQQKHRNPKQQQHHKHSDTNSVTLAPPPSPVAVPQRHCAIEISTKLTGVCETMSPMGAACVAGDYMDVYNQDCM